MCVYASAWVCGGDGWYLVGCAFEPAYGTLVAAFSVCCVCVRERERERDRERERERERRACISTNHTRVI